MDELRRLVNQKIQLYSGKLDKGSLENLKKFEIMKELLKDDACFFRIGFDDAYNILVELGVEDPKKVYRKLISYQEFEKNKENFEI